MSGWTLAALWLLGAPALKEKPADEPLAVQVTGAGAVVVGDRDPAGGPEEVKQFLTEEYRRRKVEAGRRKAAFDPHLVIRADKGARFAQVHEVMTQAQAAGFSRVTLRALGSDK